MFGASSLKTSGERPLGFRALQAQGGLPDAVIWRAGRSRPILQQSSDFIWATVYHIIVETKGHGSYYQGLEYRSLTWPYRIQSMDCSSSGLMLRGSFEKSGALICPQLVARIMKAPAPGPHLIETAKELLSQATKIDQPDDLVYVPTMVNNNFCTLIATRSSILARPPTSTSRLGNRT